METNILTKKLVIYTDCYFDGKNYYPKEIRGAINKNKVLSVNEDVKVLEDLKRHIELNEPWYNSPLLICNNPKDEEVK